jgi:hypothetical protein
VLAVLSLAAYGGVLAYACTRDREVAVFVGCVGVVGGALLAWALARAQEELVPWAAFLLGLAYAVALVARGSRLDDAAPLVAAGLLLSVELAAWSIDERYRIACERPVVAARARAVGALALAGLVAAGLVLALAAAPGGAGFGWTLAGAAAAVLAVGVAARLARRA